MSTKASPRVLPFETKATEAYYYVTPVEPDWPAAQAEEWLSAFNYYTTDVVSIHEAYPGHYVQFLALNASKATTVQKIFHTSFSASKKSRRSPGRSVRRRSPHETSSRRLVLALPRLTASASMTSSVDSGVGLVSSSACTIAMVRLMPHADPSTPHWVTSSSRAEASAFSDPSISYFQL